MIGPGVATTPAMPQATPAADAAGFRGEATSGTEGGAAASAFERLMEPASASSAPATTSSPPAATTDAREGAADTAEGTPATADPAQLLALLSQATMATTSTAAPASGAGTASTSVGSVAAAQAAAARPTPAVGAAGWMTSGVAVGSATASTAGAPSTADAAVPSFGTADGAGAMALPADLGMSSAATATATGGARSTASPAAFADPAALLAPGLPGASQAPAATTAATTPANVADAVSLAVAGDAAAPIDAARGADAAPDSPSWLAAALPATSTQSTSAPAAVPPATLAMPTDPADGFDDGLTTHVTWMAAQGVGEARIRITPDHLGTIDLVLNIDGQRISADFQSAHADVRQALEGGLGRLRDQLAQHGLQLVQAQVGDGGDSRRSPRRDDVPAPGGEAHDRSQAPTVSAPVSTPARRARLLDTYA